MCQGEIVVSDILDRMMLWRSFGCASGGKGPEGTYMFYRPTDCFLQIALGFLVFLVFYVILSV